MQGRRHRSGQLLISEGVYSPYVHGAMGDVADVDVTMFKDACESLAERALEVSSGWR